MWGYGNLGLMACRAMVPRGLGEGLRFKESPKGMW